MPSKDSASPEEESSAILDYRIGVIESTIQKSKNIPDTTRAELLAMVAGLKPELAILSQTHEEEVASITRFADASAHEASRSQKNPHLSKTALHGLRASIQGLEDSHPVLVSTVGRFANALSSLGL